LRRTYSGGKNLESISTQGLKLTGNTVCDFTRRMIAMRARGMSSDVMETVRTAVELPESTGKVALQGYCLGALIAFITAARYEVDAAVAYHRGDTEKYLGEVGGLDAPLLMHLGEEDEFISKTAQTQIKAAPAKSPTPPFTAIRVSVTPSPGTTGRITIPQRRRSPTGGQVNFYKNNCGELRSRVANQK
jgi:dienelactone hydrolase